MTTNATTPKATSDGWYRPGPAIKPELRAGLERAVELSGAKKLSALLAAIAGDPERAAELLKPLVGEALARKNDANPGRALKQSMARIASLVKEGKIDPAQLARQLEKLRAGKAAGA